MFPEKPTAKITDTPIDAVQREFVAYVRSQLSQTMGEIAMRNNRIQENDAYIYGDLLSRMLDIPIGHDKTSVNWLRRTVEIHRTQFMGRGFQPTSTYQAVDINATQDSNEKAQLTLENQKRKIFAEQRRQLMEEVVRDNGGHSFWAELAENASAVGDSVVKTWYDADNGKFRIEPVEAVEHVYCIWSKDDFRKWDLIAYVHQVSKEVAERDFNVGPDVQTSPLGMPLSVLSTANTVEYISTQPMVTIMEITGKAQGWKTNGAGVLSKCDVGQETELNATIVGANVHQLIDDPKKIPHYYIFKNKKQRRRPWGAPDISKAAIDINLTFIETLSDWRTASSRINFPKYKAMGFAFGTQFPTPTPRKVEYLPLVEGQDLQPLQNPNTVTQSQEDFQRQIAELKDEFVREVGIGQMLFDAPDLPMNSSQALKTASQSIGDITASKQQLWAPVLIKMFGDMFQTLSYYDDNIKELVNDDENWHLTIQWPAMLNKDDPVWHTMLLNRLNTNSISIQSYLEALGENAKEEIDRITEEMENPITAAIHGKMFQLLAEFKIAGPPTATPPATKISLSGVLTPEQEANIASMHQFGDGPIYGPSAGPQGELGIRAANDAADFGRISGQGYATGQPVVSGGQPLQNNQPQGPQNNGQTPPQQPEPIQATPANNTPGSQPQSQPGSGQTPTSGQGKLNQKNQRKGG